MNTNLTQIAALTVKFLNQGWYHRDAFLKKKMNNNLILTSCCVSCFNSITFELLKFSKIIYFNKSSNVFSVYCICIDCSDKIILGEISNIRAPNNFKEIWEILIKSNQLKYIVDDFKLIDANCTSVLENAINHSKFNYNEKLALFNNLANANCKLSNNIDIEIEKHQILNEQLTKNDKLIMDIKTQFRKFTCELIKDNHTNITEQLDKLNEINNVKKYSIPECKICMMREVKVALQCGHLLCYCCYKNILKNTDKSQYELDSENEDGDIKDIDIIECPICRTISTLSVNIYF